MEQIFISILTVINLLIIINGIEGLLSKLFKNANEFTGYAIPIYIILGSLFHILHLLLIFNITLFLVSLIFIFRKSLSYKNYNFIFAVLITYFTFRDALNHITWNHPDAGSNFKWQTSILNEYIYNYPIGFSILSSNISQFINFERSINYVAASIAIVIAYEVYKLNSKNLGTLKSLFFQFIILIPFSSTILYTRIGFNTGQILFLIFVLILNFIYTFLQNQSRKINLIKFSLICFTSALVAPHVFITWSIVLFILGIYLTFRIKNYLLILNIGVIQFIFILIPLIFFSKINSFIKFKELVLNNDLNKGNKLQTRTEINAVSDLFFNFISLKSHIRSPFESLLSFGSYISIIFLIIIIIFSKNLTIKSISILGLLLGFVTQTGIFELSYFKGRAGIYFYYTFIFVLLLIYDKILILRINKIFISFNAVSIIAISIYLMLNPNYAYRLHDEEVYFKVKSIINKISPKLYVMSDFENMSLIDSRIKQYNLDFTKSNYSKMDFIILNISNKLPDPYLSGLKKYEDNDISEFNNKFDKIIQNRLVNNFSFYKILLSNNFQLLDKNLNYIILKNIN